MIGDYMKNLALITLLSLQPLSVLAEDTILCIDRSLQDASYSAAFTTGKAGTKISLFVPSGESDGQRYSGNCRSEQGSIELSLICTVKTTCHSGYEVRLFSIGGSELTASITPWSSAGQGKSITIPCGN